MPDNFFPFDPPARSTIRERLIANQAKRVALLEKQIDLTSLQLQRASLSPYEYDVLVTQRELLKDFRVKSANIIQDIRRQDAAADKAEVDLKLRPSRLRKGEPLRRSTEDRNFAILGMLQRERRQNAPLSREALARAQAVAASRKRYSSAAQSSLRGSRGYSYEVRPQEVQAEPDPCVEYRAYQKKRRAVMAAQGLLAIGYKTKHYHRGC